MFRMFRVLRSTVFLLWLAGALAVSTVALGVQAIALTAQVTSLTASAAATALSHRREMARAVARTKAKARLRRALVAVPVLGAAAAAAFEAQDFRDWQQDHPGGTFADYSCETAELSAEVVDEVLQDLPSQVRPERDMVLGWLPTCSQPD